MTAPPLPPVPSRQRLAEAILEALHDPAARRILTGLAQDETAVRDWLGLDDADHRDAVRARARRASATVTAAPLGAPAGSLTQALEDAALLFDAGLFYEAHELLEPHWRGAAGHTRQALQGLIQIAVGYQHRVNGNARGARSLLVDGVSRVQGRWLIGVSLDDFAHEVAEAIGPAGGGAAGHRAVPRFPRVPGR